MLKISQYPENKAKAIEIIDNVLDKFEPEQEIQEPKRFLSVLTTTITVHSGVRTESSEIDVPAELLNKKFKITDIWIYAINITNSGLSTGNNLLVGLIIGGKSLLMGVKQTFNGNTTTLDMLPVNLNVFVPSTVIPADRKAYFKLLSELFNNVKKLKIVYSHKSTNPIHYLIYVTIGGVIL